MDGGAAAPGFRPGVAGPPDTARLVTGSDAAAMSLRAARSLATDGVVLASRAAARAVARAAADDPYRTDTGSPRRGNEGLGTASGRGASADRASRTRAGLDRIEETKRMEEALESADAVARDARNEAREARRELALVKERLMHARDGAKRATRLETELSRRDREVEQLREQLDAFRRDARAKVVTESKEAATRADSIARRLRSALDSEAAERARLAGLVASQRRDLAELRQRVGRLVQASKIVGDTRAAVAATDKHFRGRVQYEAVSAEMEAMAEDLAYVPHSPEQRAEKRSLARERAKSLLQRADELSSPDEARGMRFDRPQTARPSELRRRRAKEIRRLLHSAEAHGREDGPDVPPSASAPSPSAAAGAVASGQRGRQRRLSLLPGSLEGLGASTAQAFREKAEDSLPILDGWLAQSVADKMEQTRSLDRRIESMTHRQRALEREIERLKRDRFVQDKVLQVFLQERGVEHAEDVVRSVVAAVLHTMAVSSDRGLEEAARSLARKLSSVGIHSPKATRSRSRVGSVAARSPPPEASPEVASRRFSVGAGPSEQGREGLLAAP